MAGADPSFGAVHILRTVMILSGGRTGRKELVERLGIGEGSVRTILKRLKAARIIGSSRPGHSLTLKGKNLAGRVAKRISNPLRTSSIENGCAVQINGAKLSSSLELRDRAVRAGASMALVLEMRDGDVSFPEKGMEFCESMPELDAEIKGKFSGDGVVVVCSACDYSTAENAALMVAMNLSGVSRLITGCCSHAPKNLSM